LVTSTPSNKPSTPTTTRPKGRLGKHGQVLWNSIKRSYQISEKADLEILRLVCEAEDRLCAIKQQIKHDGLVVMGRHGPREHPLLKARCASSSRDIYGGLIRTSQGAGPDVHAVPRSA
jgi:hypothetical protein